MTGIVEPKPASVEPEFLNELLVHRGFDQQYGPLVMLWHRESHPKNHGVNRRLVSIASGLGLCWGIGFPKMARPIYCISGIWCLDFGHPSETVALGVPSAVWEVLTVHTGRVLVAVSLESSGNPFMAEDRILTGRARVAYQAPSSWSRLGRRP
ncbi:hypothetical protein [Streptomyces sp. NPDC089799]|uniref:hypothetical protein n=1 Tax=Streptomyces sp. NPDC089799 TaxID=3155066 RepID=UPI003420A634